jgi:hypothetical protein
MAYNHRNSTIREKKRILGSGPIRRAPAGAKDLLGFRLPYGVCACAAQSASIARSVVAARRAALSALLLLVKSRALGNLQKRQKKISKQNPSMRARSRFTMPTDRTRAGQLEQPRVDASLVKDVFAFARQHANVIAVLEIDDANRARLATDRFG